MTATLKALKEELRRRYHLPIPKQGAWLMSKIRGYYRYFAVPTNIAVLDSFRTQVERLWLRTLRRRSQRHNLNWQRMRGLGNRWLLHLSFLHHLPEERFLAKTEGKSPVR